MAERDSATGARESERDVAACLIAWLLGYDDEPDESLCATIYAAIADGIGSDAYNDVLGMRSSELDENRAALERAERALEQHRQDFKMQLRKGTEQVRAERDELRRALEQKDEALRLAGTMYERATFDAHDREWARDAGRQIREALASSSSRVEDTPVVRAPVIEGAPDQPGVYLPNETGQDTPQQNEER